MNDIFEKITFCIETGFVKHVFFLERRLSRDY